MRIGIVWTATPRLAVTTVRFERYLRGFQVLGHDAVIVSTREAAAGFPCAGVTVPDLSALRDPGLWAGLRLDVALVVTWLGMGDVLAAIRPHVRRIISLADSDGCVGARVFPGRLLARTWVMQQCFADRLRAAGWWLRQYLWAYPRVDRPVLESARLADRIVVYSRGAKVNLQAFFDYHREPTLGERVIACPYPVDDAFELQPVAPERDNQVVAIGRWQDPQKATHLLAAALPRYLHAGGRARFLLLGSGGADCFAPLAAAYPGRVEYRGAVSQQAVADLLGRSRILLSTSGWESGPIVASEALLRGCALVGPDSIPTFHEFCRDGNCGTTFTARTGRAVADALVRETAAWEEGRRDPLAIAAAWKGRFSAETVCRQLLAGWETSCPLEPVTQEASLCSPCSAPAGRTKAG